MIESAIYDLEARQFPPAETREATPAELKYFKSLRKGTETEGERLDNIQFEPADLWNKVYGDRGGSSGGNSDNGLGLVAYRDIRMWLEQEGHVKLEEDPKIIPIPDPDDKGLPEVGNKSSTRSHFSKRDKGKFLKQKPIVRGREYFTGMHQNFNG